MATHPYLDSLKARHSTLEQAIREEEGRPCPDVLSISELKRRRLQVKEMIHRFGVDNT